MLLRALQVSTGQEIQGESKVRHWREMWLESFKFAIHKQTTDDESTQTTEFPDLFKLKEGRKRPILSTRRCSSSWRILTFPAVMRPAGQEIVDKKGALSTNIMSARRAMMCRHSSEMVSGMPAQGGAARAACFCAQSFLSEHDP